MSTVVPARALMDSDIPEDTPTLPELPEFTPLPPPKEDPVCEGCGEYTEPEKLKEFHSRWYCQWCLPI